jgi:hypothetical protein
MSAQVANPAAGPMCSRVAARRRYHFVDVNTWIAIREGELLWQMIAS